MILKVTIPGAPVAQGRPRFSNVHGYPMAYESKKCRDYKLYAAMIIQDAWQSKPIDGYFMVTIDVYLELPKSWSKKEKNRALSGLVRPGKPDLDNYAKSLLDACNKVVWNNDSQVVSLIISKWYDIVARAELEVNFA